jgi:hypothetical protein
LVFKVIAALVLLFAFSAWGFAAQGDIAYLVAIVIGFVLISGLLPYLLWRIWRGSSPEARSRAEGERQDFGDWAEGDFLAWQDRVKASSAAIEIILPIAAVAFGMVAFDIVEHLT